MTESKSEKIQKLQDELGQYDRIDELRKELEGYGYSVELKEVKDKRENIARGLVSCGFWVGAMLALPLIGSGIGYSQGATSGALGGAGAGVGLAMVLMLVVQKFYDMKRKKTDD